MENTGRIKKYEDMFEASVNDDGLQYFRFGKKTLLDSFIEKNDNFFKSNRLEVNDNDNDGVYCITNDSDDLYTISKKGDVYFVTYSSSNGQVDEYYITIDDILSDIPLKLLRSQKIVPPVDLMKYGIDKKYISSENEEDILEKKSKAKETSKTKNSEICKVGLTTPEASIANNKGYNFDAMPGHTDTNPYYNNVNSKRIEIGDQDPIKSFKEWSGNFWRKDGEEHLKYEPNSGVSQEEKVKSI